MTQFGPGAELAAQCPRVPPPDGWRPWTDADGPVPEALARRALALVENLSLPLGATESYPIPGTTTLIRLEPRAWSRDAKGDLVQGCFRAGGIFLPAETSLTAPVATPENKLNKAIGVLTIASLAAGTIATLASLGRES